MADMYLLLAGVILEENNVIHPGWVAWTKMQKYRKW